MRGTFFKKPLEFKLEIDGESWTQGASIKGSLTIINQNGSAVDLSKLGCHLCFCNTKKMKAKDPSGITLIESILLHSNENQLNFNFKLTKDCPVTDAASSLYIVCGDMEFPFNVGFLQLNITPSVPILYFVQIFEQFYRFKFKPFKNKKDFIEASITPPDSKEWASIQKMLIQLKMVDEDLCVDFLVDIKKLDFSRDLNKVKNEKKQITKTLTKKQYELYGTVNQEGIKKILDEVLAEIKINPIL